MGGDRRSPAGSRDARSRAFASRRRASPRSRGRRPRRGRVAACARPSAMPASQRSKKMCNRKGRSSSSRQCLALANNFSVKVFHSSLGRRVRPLASVYARREALTNKTNQSKRSSHAQLRERVVRPRHRPAAARAAADGVVPRRGFAVAAAAAAAAVRMRPPPGASVASPPGTVRSPRASGTPTGSTRSSSRRWSGWTRPRRRCSPRRGRS